MKRPELVEKVFELLEKYTRPRLPLTYYSMDCLKVDELRELYQVLTDSPIKKGKKKRPNNLPPAGKTTYPYRKTMCDYIAQWGLRLDLLDVTPSLLEATANYLSRIYSPFGDAFAYKRRGVLVIGNPGTGKTVLVKKFLEEEPRRTKLVAEDRPFVLGGRGNKPLVIHENQLNSLEGRKVGFPLDVMIHLDLSRDTYHIEDIPYEEAIHDVEFNIPNGRIADSMQRVKFVKSGIVTPQVREEYRGLGLSEDEMAVLINVAPIRVLPNSKDLHDFYTHMRTVILDRVA